MGFEPTFQPLTGRVLSAKRYAIHLALFTCQGYLVKCGVEPITLACFSVQPSLCGVV